MTEVKKKKKAADAAVPKKKKKAGTDSAPAETKIAKAVKGSKKNAQEGFKVLSQISGLRQSPGMYLGEQGADMVYRQVKEVADNSYDEHIAGRNNVIEIVYDVKNDMYIVADKAGGIPTTLKEMEDGGKEPIMVSAYTRVHAGGKFDDKAYKTSAGTHGVGVTAVNATSSRIRVWSNYEKKTQGMEYAEGVEVTALKKWDVDSDVAELLQDKVKEYGTITAWTPDQTIVSTDAKRGKKLPKKYEHASLDVQRTCSWLETMARINVGLEIRFSVVDGKKSEKFLYLNKTSIADVIKKIAEDNELAVSKPFEIRTDFITLSIAWADYSDDHLFRTSVNASPTADGGWHVVGFRDALEKALKPFIKTGKNGAKTFTANDLLIGAIGYFDWRMHGASYTSQVKDKLASRVDKEIQELLEPKLTEFFDKNKKIAKDIIKRAEAMTKGRKDLQLLVKSMSEANKKVKGNVLPDFLSAAPDAKPHERELFVCEGDSAGTQVDGARDPEYQEVMKATGKPLNGLKASLSDVLKHKEVQGLLVSIGADIKSLDTKAENPTMSAENLRVGNVLFLADADPDGPVHGNTPVKTDCGTYKMHDLAERWAEHPFKFRVPVLVNGQMEWHEATAPRVTMRAETALRIEFDDGSIRICTPCHKWETDEGMKTAEMLTTFDVIIGMKNGMSAERRVVSIEQQHFMTTQNFYCLTVPSTGKFLLPDNTGGFISSSNCHINTLFLAVIYRLLPDMMRQGRVWVVDAPLYNVIHKDQHYGGATFEECRANCPKDVRDKDIVRAKGWGEVSKEVVQAIACSPKHRKLIQINPFVSKEHELFFRSVVADDAVYRRRLLGLE